MPCITIWPGYLTTCKGANETFSLETSRHSHFSSQEPISISKLLLEISKIPFNFWPAPFLYPLNNLPKPSFLNKPPLTEHTAMACPNPGGNSPPAIELAHAHCFYFSRLLWLKTQTSVLCSRSSKLYVFSVTSKNTEFQYNMRHSTTLNTGHVLTIMTHRNSTYQGVPCTV